ncbi:PTS sugar transporter subunit IIB [Pseudalkalibacillus caeni]|uniref:PTS galactitol transporter subunit IIB n=1 Tax=Exobacillus caeni TaxID=2574798 RepID=A0A5R9F8R9_9BACL|nr:PTS sugar transporter subunit IIB [Pseudalkalibacillus caeni]TLS38716.1 PTS galactitol transporter subunit IIB [Pseudalkalibacillus caeni]
MSKKIAVICGTGAATSTIIMNKLTKFLEEKQIKARTTQSNVNAIANSYEDYDLIVSTTHVPNSVTTKVINAVPILTGIGADKVYDEIEKELNS